MMRFRRLIALAFIAGLLCGDVSAAASSIKDGVSCTAKGKVVNQSGKKFVCTVVGKKLVWKLSVKKPSTPSQKPRPTSTPATSSASPKPSPLSTRQAPVKIKLDLTPPVVTLNKCHLTQGATLPKMLCIFGDKKAIKKIVVVGDDQAAQWFSAFDAIGNNFGYQVIFFTKALCPVADIKILINQGQFPECAAWNQALQASIRFSHVDMIVISNSTQVPYTLADSSQDYDNAWVEGLKQAVAKLQLLGKPVVLLGDTPNLGFDPIKCLQNNPDNFARCDFKTSDSSTTLRTKNLAQTLGISYIDPMEQLCSNSICDSTILDFNAYLNSRQISASTGLYIAKPIAKLLGL